MGVPEPSPDLDTEAKISKDKNRLTDLFVDLKLDPNTIKSFYRFRRTPNSIHVPIIKVELHNKDEVARCFRASHRLKDLHVTSGHKIYMNPDLTPIQRQEKILITNRNELNKNRLHILLWHQERHTEKNQHPFQLTTNANRLHVRKHNNS